MIGQNRTVDLRTVLASAPLLGDNLELKFRKLGKDKLDSAGSRRFHTNGVRALNKSHVPNNIMKIKYEGLSIHASSRREYEATKFGLPFFVSRMTTAQELTDNAII